MDIKNLQRAAEIAEQLPVIDEARKALSLEDAQLRVITREGRVLTIPKGVRYNVIRALNAEYEILRKEAVGL